MIRDIFATKIGMTQAWTTKGKRLPVTRCRIDDNLVISQKDISVLDTSKKRRTFMSVPMLEIGYGTKKLKNMTKPLKTTLEKSGFSVGVKRIRGIRVTDAENMPKVGSTISVSDILQVGDVVQVRGTSKGTGFTGAMKRHNFKGGPKTHGQSDRARAVGSIGMGTTPGRVFKGKRMPGHSGDSIVAVKGLVVLHIDSAQKEIWLSGPVPGSVKSIVRIQKENTTKKIEILRKQSGLPEEVEEAVVVPTTSEETSE